MKPSVEFTPDQLAAVAEETETATKTGRQLITVKLYSKQAALESLLKCLQALDLEERVKALEDAQQAQHAQDLP